MIKKDCPWIPPFAGSRKVLIKVSVASFVLVLLSCPEKGTARCHLLLILYLKQWRIAGV